MQERHGSVVRAGMNYPVILCTIEVREDTTRKSPGLLRGVLMRYGEQAVDRRERFKQGALAWSPSGVILNRQHSSQEPIMVVHPRVDGDQVSLEEPLPDTQSGRDAASAIRSGAVTGLSVEFRSLRQTVQRGVRTIEEAILTGAGLVDAPGYQDATVEMRRRLDAPHRTAPWL